MLIHENTLTDSTEERQDQDEAHYIKGLKQRQSTPTLHSPRDVYKVSYMKV